MTFLHQMKNIAVFGAGGFGREIACMIRRINEASNQPQWNFIGFYDDNPLLAGKMISHLGKYLGGTAELNKVTSQLSVAIAVGSPCAVKQISEKITNPNISFPNLFAPTVRFNDPESFHIGKGNIVQDNCTFSCDVTVGDFNMLNGSIVLGHDVQLGSYNAFMPNIRISGETSIGDFNFFGVGSIVLQRLRIGNNVHLGPGSVLMTKPKNGCLYMGNPAKKTVF